MSMNEQNEQEVNKTEETMENVETVENKTLEEQNDFLEQGSENSSEDQVETQDDDKKYVQELEKQIAELQQKLEEAENRYLRLYADFENFKRRTRLEQEANEKYRAQELITNLLPAIDNFERALAIEPDNPQTKALLEGCEMVYKSILEALKKEGAEQIEAVGKEFDPNYHQAVMQANTHEYGPNIVVEEFQKGYILNDRVIRPSMVKVNQ